MSKVIEIGAELTNESIIKKVASKLGLYKKGDYIVNSSKKTILFINNNKVVYDSRDKAIAEEFLNEYLKDEILQNVSLYGGTVLSVDNTQDGIDIEIEVSDEG